MRSAAIATIASSCLEHGADGSRTQKRRSLKCECVYLSAFETGSQARTGIARWVGYYNAERPHSAFAGRTPDEVYATQANHEKLAA